MGLIIISNFPILVCVSIILTQVKSEFLKHLIMILRVKVILSSVYL